MTTESLLVLTPITMPDAYDITPQSVAWFLTFTAGVVFPITYFISKLEKHYQERQIIFTLLILCLVSCMLIIDLPFFNVTFIRFLIFYTVLFVSCNILESVDSALLAKIFPVNLHLGVCNSGFTIILTTTGGKFIGSFLITILGWFILETIIYDYLIAFYLICYLTLCILVYLNFSDLRVKAIARIIQKKQ
jgi:hypothetical protein